MAGKEIELLYLDEDSATFKTEGLYRVVYHGKVRRDIYHSEELLTADEALRTAQIHNSPAHTDFPFTQKGEMWAEAVSYKEWHRRDEMCQQLDTIREAEITVRKEERSKAERKLRKLRKKVKRLKAAK